MQFKTFSLFALLAASVHAAPQPIKRAIGPSTDIEILNYALTLEYLEDAFYTEGLDRYDEQAFHSAGLNRSLFVEISKHEASHVEFLKTALGEQATKACKYSFPYTDLKSFVALSMVLEGVGVSAYLGAAGSITNKQYLTAAGAILTTEARHNTWISSVANGQTPWSGDFDTPLNFDQVYSLATPFIKECPSSNPALPLKSFPALNVTTPALKPGSKIDLEFNAVGTEATQPLFVAFLNGLTPIFEPYDAAAKTATLPANLTNVGTAYAIITSSQNVTDESTVAGPAILMLGATPAKAGGSPGTAAPGSGSGTTQNAAGRVLSQTFGVVAGALAASFILVL